MIRSLNYRPVWIVVTIGVLLASCSLAMSDDAPAKAKAKKADGKKGDIVQQMLDTYDKNADKAIDVKELEPFVERLNEHRAEESKAGKKKAKSAEPLTAAAVMKQFDVNKDGKLDTAELQAMGKELLDKHENSAKHEKKKKNAT